jgi:hypothetical protein
MTAFRRESTRNAWAPALDRVEGRNCAGVTEEEA